MMNYHLVWIPKRRKRVLVGDVEKRLREIIWDTCKEKDWQIIALEIMPDSHLAPHDYCENHRL